MSIIAAILLAAMGPSGPSVTLWDGLVASVLANLTGLAMFFVVDLPWSFIWFPWAVVAFCSLGYRARRRRESLIGPLVATSACVGSLAFVRLLIFT